MFLVIGIRRLRLCHAEPNYCLRELNQPSPVAVVPLVALTPPCRACFMNSFGDPRYRFSLGCQPLDSKRMLRASLSFFANLAVLAPHLQHHT